ncbi:MAG: methionine--tRNA ligase [Lentisphaeria bacterium]|nr:methionine--tRNA ligase [Lentisphaeria bacterium]
MASNYYVTTPIYYVNDKPHIGHSYTTVLADILTRFHTLFGEDSYMLTGTDEHGQKVQKAAAQRNMTPIEHCNETVVRFQELWKKLGIKNSDFIRTTEERHMKIVRSILQDLYDRGLIYKAEYTGHYCVPCERYFTEKDLLEGGLCPDCHRSTNELVESNYFFKMGQYRDWLVDYIKSHPGFIQPEYRANETLGFLRKELGDLCISRPKSRLSWGIELPFDHDYVCYVWFDALINYISAIGYGTDPMKFEKWWSCAHHIVGKDILTTHTVYWPTMLHAIGLPMPQSVFAHGWWRSGSEKMSKSLGNVVNPMDMIEIFGVDAFRYCLMAEMVLGQDASFTEEAFVKRYNSDLANDLGNMLSRAVKLTIKNFNGIIPAPGEYEEIDRELMDQALAAPAALRSAVENMRLDRGVEEVMNVVRAANRYMEKTAPWTLAKQGDTARLATVLYTASETLRIVSGLLLPIMPEKMTELRLTLGMKEADAANAAYEKLSKWGGLEPGLAVRDIAALFPRLMPKEKETAAEPKNDSMKVEKKKNAAEKKETVAVSGDQLVTIDEFFHTQLKTAKILEAGKVEGADKLLKLRIEVGSEQRTLVAGIAKAYTPEQVIGRTIVIVANLKPAKIRGIESQGMLLAVKSGDTLRLISVDGGDFPSGCAVG